MVFSAIVHPEPPAARAPQAKPFPRFRGEWRIAREAAHLALSAPALALAPRGHGQPVVLSPGWRAPESSMEPLRYFLARKGYTAQHWGLGVNRGDVQGAVRKLVPRIRALATERGMPVSLVGWSLGGVVSREIARDLQDAVSCVVTFGSPVIGGPSYTVTAGNYSHHQREAIVQRIAERERSRPIPVPISAVFSRIDEIVDWPACIDRLSPRVTHYEVRSTHFSMGIDPAVWQVVLAALAKNATRA